MPAPGTSFSRPLGFGTTRVAQSFSSTVSRTAAATSERDARPVPLQLARGQVHRLDRADGIREIQVLDGTLWLTATPADGDILLRSGERFALPVAFPVVFEALKDASVLLARRDR
ncbi:MAG TPA: DUF2917 domain-containing protein [Chthoniobacter sp.]|nr:DUF2917 domain-containing protein [Chthoniobacter sp.]